jgi:hypothetical protein
MGLYTIYLVITNMIMFYMSCLIPHHHGGGGLPGHGVDPIFTLITSPIPGWLVFLVWQSGGGFLFNLPFSSCPSTYQGLRLGSGDERRAETRRLNALDLFIE